MPSRAPFPYPGGKQPIAPCVWEALGDVPHYVEPFFGSGAVLLNRPDSHGWPRTETVNDNNHYIVNVWRAIRSAPDAVAEGLWCPPATIEVQARAARLRSRSAAIAEALARDPDTCDPVAAADWIYGACACIGSDWARAVPPAGGRGVNVNALHLGHTGQGVNALHLGNAGQGVRERLRELATRLARVRVRCGDWQKVVTPAVLTAVAGPVGIFLDPPYRGTGVKYGEADADPLHVAAWAVEHGADPRLRIVLAGHAGDYELPGWRTVRWIRNGGFGNQGAANASRSVETLWLSPGCLQPSAAALPSTTRQARARPGPALTLLPEATRAAA